MNRDDIQTLFITAAEVDRRLPDTARPARLKSQSLDTIHTREEMNGWGTARLAEERKAFWEGVGNRVTSEEVSAYERALDLVALCRTEKHRRALWAWARAEAGGRPFAHWCRDEGVSRTTGYKRKNDAVNQILCKVLCSERVHTLDVVFDGFTDSPEISDKEPIITNGVRAWNDGDLPMQSQPEARSFSWAEKQNKIRRARAAKREQATA